MAANHSTRPPRRFGLKPQLLLLLFALNLISATAYTIALYANARDEIVAGIDGRLQAAAHAVREIVPEGYHQRIKGADSVSDGEYRMLLGRLSRFANDSGFTYVYTYMKFGDGIHTVATSATPGEIAEHRETHFFTHYRTAPRELYHSFADGRVRFDEYADSFGRFRSIYVPVREPGGLVYVIGADVDLGRLDRQLGDALRKSVFIGLMLFALSMAAGWLLIARIVGPLVRLTEFTRSMETRSFQADRQEVDAMQKLGRDRGDEVGSLAEAMAGMIGHLQRYLREIEEATTARERVEGELSAARDIQIGMLPRTFPPFPDRREIDVFAMLEPAKHVGGDLYDYFLIDEQRLFFIVGDVSGKGVPAALFMAMTTTLFKAHAASGRSTGDIMQWVNDELARDNAAEMFVTVFAGILDLRSGVVEYSDGGHEAPFIVRRADGAVERLDKHQGMALGVFEGVSYQTGHFTLGEGDALVLFTDGVSEATGVDDELFTIDRIADALAAARAVFSARVISEGLAESVRGFVGTVPQSDDIAILTICFESPAVSPA